MDFLKLECFLNVAKARSYSQAAEKISLSQSSVSKHIIQLEKELGVKLLNRDAHQVTLTEAGKAVFKDMEALWDIYQRILKNIKPYQGDKRRTIRIGGVNHLQKVGAMAPIIDFMREYPDINVNFEESDTLTLLKYLEKGRIDFALVSHIYFPLSSDDNMAKFPNTGFQKYTAVKDHFCLAVNQNHRLAHKESADWTDLEGEDLILLDKNFSSNEIIKNVLKYYGCTANFAFETNGMDSIQGMIAENYGIAILSRKIIEKMEGVTVTTMKTPIHRDTVLIGPEVLSDVGQSFWNFFVSYCRKRLPCC